MSRIDNENHHKLVKLDVKDKKILDILSEDSRTPISQISKKVELSRDTVDYRIKRMESQGLIQKFYPILNLLKLGYNTYHVFFVIDESKRELEFLEKLKQLNHTLFIIEYSDRWDYELVMIAKNIRELDLIISKIQAEFSDTVIERTELLEITTYQSILFSHYYNKDVKKQDKIEQEINISKYKPDKLDIQILKKLCENSKLSTYEIAKDVNLSADAIGLRIKKLINEQVIKKFTILPNLSKLDYKWYTFCIKMKTFDVEDEKKFKKFIENHPGIIRSTKTFGDYDILMCIIAINQRDFHKLVKELRTIYSSIVKHYITFVAYKEHYFNPLPSVLEENFKD